MNKTIDLNADVGESFGAWKMGHDELLMPHLTSANIACGFHAGDPRTIARTVALAIEHNVAIGAHPGLPDLVGFGRRNMAITAEEAYQIVLYQSGAMRAFAEAAGSRLHHVKAHGALYNMAANDANLSQGIVRAVRALGDEVAIVVLSGSVTETVAREAGLRVSCEVFADRRYQDSGLLVPRSDPRAMITDEQESIAQVVAMVTEGHCISVNGQSIALRADTVCLHGDQPDAVAFATALRAALAARQVTPRAFP
ncbi:MAG: LamB/YcsF family protein [Burkholderiaceae bacterium]|nr:LamB/YcsF family protein [Burkholderiaceae bacterium]